MKKPKLEVVDCKNQNRHVVTCKFPLMNLTLAKRF